MKYDDFIHEFNEVLNDNGVRITIPKTKEFFKLLSEFLIDNIEEEEKIPIREFIIFDLIVIPEKTLPDGRKSEEQYSIRVRMTEKYKSKVKNKLNNK